MLREFSRYSLLLWTSNAGVEYALRHFFSVVVGCKTSVVESEPHIWELLDKNEAASVLIVHHGSDPEADLNLIKQTRDRFSKATIIALRQPDTSLGAEALLSGAHDSMVWPGSLKELCLRVFLRLGLTREAFSQLDSSSEEDWERQIDISGRAGLTVSEAQVLSVLLNHMGDVVSRNDLSMAIDGRDWNYGDRRVDVHVASIRKKLAEVFGNKIIVSTIRSQGYQLKISTSSSGTAELAQPLK